MTEFFQVLERPEQVPDFLDWLDLQPYIAVDTETTGLDPRAEDFEVRMIQFGSVSFAWLIELPRWLGLITDVLARFPGQIVMHHSAYDQAALAAHGIRIPWSKVDDTLIMLRLAQPTESAKLKSAAKRLLGSDGGSQTPLLKAMKKQKWGWGDIPFDFPLYQRYAAMDVILTSRLYERSLLKDTRATDLYELEMDVRAVCSRMEDNGLRINPEYSDAQRRRLLNESAELKERAHEGRGVRIASTENLSRWLLASDARRMLTKRTPRGRASVDKEVLTAIAALTFRDGAHDVARDTLRMRWVEKMASAYFENFIESEQDGIIHPQIETLAARTGRMSIRNPAFQTLPKPSGDSDSTLVRRAVVPLREGDVLLSADFDQIELRIAASLSGDRGLIDGFRGGDFFTHSARELYKDAIIDKDDPRRATAKTFWYSSLYGAGVATMATRAGVSVDRMHEIKDSVHRTYPKFFQLQKTCEQEARTTGVVTTPMGRRLPVDAGMLYAATNYKIQGAAGDVFKKGLVALAQAGFEDTMIIPVHDEVLFSMPLDDVPEASKIIVQSMQSNSYTVPLTSGISEPGKNWAEI
jgi:DNA polymerase-1